MLCGIAVVHICCNGWHSFGHLSINSQSVLEMFLKDAGDMFLKSGLPVS